MNSITERWLRSLRAEPTDRTLIWSIPHLPGLLRDYEAFYNDHRPHRALGQATPLRPLPDNVIDLETFRIQRRDRAGGLLHEYKHLVETDPGLFTQPGQREQLAPADQQP